jgi:hypothetical protein
MSLRLAEEKMGLFQKRLFIAFLVGGISRVLLDSSSEDEDYEKESKGKLLKITNYFLIDFGRQLAANKYLVTY